MKKLPEHTPKAMAWEDLLKKMDFDSQVKGHLSALPQYTPRDDSWGKIVAQLDSRKAVPIWLPWSVAAAVVAFVLLTFIGLKQINQTAPRQEFKAYSSPKAIQMEKKLVPSDSTLKIEIEEPQAEMVVKKSSLVKKVDRKVETIEVPELRLPEMELSQSQNISLGTSEQKQNSNKPPKTLHQVSISWSRIKPGLQVKTSFGRAETELGQKPEASTQQINPLTLGINN